jgi:SAM-dependent methyltransferase
MDQVSEQARRIPHPEAVVMADGSAVKVGPERRVIHDTHCRWPGLSCGTMTDALAALRDSYDALAAEHADVVGSGLDDRPLDRALLATFAELVRSGGNDRVADVGCGAGRVTVLLSRLGLDASGIDLSPGMVALARRTYPQLRFKEGSMLALDLPAAALGGLLAYYSIIHIPWPRRPEVFAEFGRVLAPGGMLMLVFQIGDELRHRSELLGTPISVNWYRQQPADVADLLREAGFELWVTAVREPEGTEQTTQGYVLARKPPAANA